MKKLLVALFASLLLTACAPEVPVEPGTTTTVVTTPACTPRATGGDDTAVVAQILTNCSYVQIIEPLRIDSQLTIPAGRNITWSGSGQFYRNTIPSARSVPMLYIASTGVTLNNIQLRGPNPKVQNPLGPPVCNYHIDQEAQHGVTIQGGKNVTVNGGRISNQVGDGIYIRGQASGITLNNLTVDCVGRTAVTNLDSTGVRINGGTFTTAVWWIFNIELTSGIVRDYYIDRPNIGLSLRQFLLANCSGTGYYSNVVINKPVFLSGSRQDYTASCGTLTINF